MTPPKTDVEETSQLKHALKWCVEVIEANLQCENEPILKHAKRLLLQTGQRSATPEVKP